MEYVFEDFIFGFISRKWPSLKIRSQSTDFLALREGFKVFMIRNDIYISNKLIIDTKYKIRSLKDNIKAGVSQNDLYQMVSYSLRRNCNNVLLLYPNIENSLNTPALFQIPSEMISWPVNINLNSVDITFEDINTADNIIYERLNQILNRFI
jgi:5-methylcytosine-specific restriction enzyme subunit McrC